MAGIVLTTVSLDAANGFAQEAVVNSFVTSTPGGTAAEAAAIAQPLIRDFYNVGGAPMDRAIGAYLAPALSRAAGDMVVRSYDIIAHLDGSPHGSPILTNAYTLVAAGNTEPVANQVAACMTLVGRNALTSSVEIGSTRPRARQTGRIYLGGLNVLAIDRTANTNATVALGFRGDLMEAAERLQDALVAAGSIWCVWSRANEAIHGITSVQVDDSLDVLRSRKIKPATRNKRVFAPVPSLALGA